MQVLAHIHMKLRECTYISDLCFFIYQAPVSAPYSSPFTSSHLALVFVFYEVIISTSHSLSLPLLYHAFPISLLALLSSSLSLLLIPLRFAFL